VLVFESSGGQRAASRFRKPQLDFVHREIPRLD
jgi:hypothetical protein